MPVTDPTEPRRQPYKFEARIGFVLMEIERGLGGQIDPSLVQFVVLQMKPSSDKKGAGHLMLQIRDEPKLITRDTELDGYKTIKERLDGLRHRIDSLAEPDCERRLTSVEIERLIAAAKLKPRSFTESMLFEPSSGASPPGPTLETTLDPDDVKTLLVAEDIAARGLTVRAYNGILLQLATAVPARVRGITVELQRVGFVEKKGDLFFMTDAMRKWSGKNPGTSKLGDAFLRRMISSSVTVEVTEKVAPPLPSGLGKPGLAPSNTKPAATNSKPSATREVKLGGKKNPYPGAPATLLANVGRAALKYGWRADRGLFEKLAALLDYTSVHEVNELRTLLVTTYKLMTIDAEGALGLTTVCRDWLASMKFEPNLTEAQLLTMLRPSTDRYSDLDTQLLTDISVAFEACPNGLTDERFSIVAMNQRDGLDQDAVLALRKSLGKRALIIMNGPFLSYTSKLSSWLQEIGHEPTVTLAEIRQLLNIPEPAAEVDEGANNAPESTLTSSSEAPAPIGRKIQRRAELSDDHRQFLGAHHRAEKLFEGNLPAQIGAEIARRLGFSVPGNVRQSCEWRGYIERKESARRGTYYWHVTDAGVEAAGKYIDSPTFTDDVLRTIIEWWSAKYEPAPRKFGGSAKSRQPKDRAMKIVDATPVVTVVPIKTPHPSNWLHYLRAHKIAQEELKRTLSAIECTELALKFSGCKDVVATRNQRASLQRAKLLEAGKAEHGIGKAWSITDAGLTLVASVSPETSLSEEDVLVFVRNMTPPPRPKSFDPPTEGTTARNDDIERAEREVAEAEATLAYKKRVLAALRG